LKTAIDQLAFMSELLELDRLQQRITAYGQRMESEEMLSKGSAAVLGEVFLRGEIRRGDVAKIADVSPRTAQKITRQLLDLGLADSITAKGSLRFAIPARAGASYFPNLFPAGAE
jgi:Fic family protein